ncbi:hypothetical protein pb186bvf_005999 [Paramecium bursaria]
MKKIKQSLNPHNQFLIDELNQLKFTYLRIGQDRIANIYNKIIHSIELYPMPLLCEKQLLSLDFVGDKTAALLLRFIKQKYQQYLIIEEDLENEEIEKSFIIEAEQQIVEADRENRFNIDNIMLKLSGDKRSTFQNDEILPPKQLSIPMIQKEIPIVKISKPIKNKSPQIHTPMAAILISLYELGKEDKLRKYFRKYEIDMQIRGDDKITDLHYENVSIKTFYVTRLDMQGCFMYALTNDGKDKAKRLIEDMKKRGLYNPPRKIGQEKIQQEKSQQIIQDEQFETILLIDNRERMEGQWEQIEKKLKTLYKVNCETRQLPIGDFLWIQKCGKEEYICDFIVERKTYNDLHASIMDRRYMNQKQLLKASDIKNIFYIIERSNGDYLKDQLESAVSTMIMCDKFKIVEMDNIDDTISWLATFTSKIKLQDRKKQSYKEFQFYGTAQSFTIQQVWGRCLTGIQGIGEKSANQITKQYKTPKQLFDVLKSGISFQQALQIKGLNENLIKMLEKLFLNLAQTHSQFNFTRKPLLRPKQSRQFSREKSQPAFNPVTPQTKFRVSNFIINKDKMQKTSNNFFTQHNSTTESTKLTRGQNQSLLKRHEIDQKQQIFEQQERDEELQFLRLCQDIDKIL